MKVVPQVGSKEHIEWGWSSYEQRVRRAHWFRVWDGLTATLACFQFTCISGHAAFDPYDTTVLGVTYFLDAFNVVDICVKVVKYYKIDRRNVELRRGNSRLDDYLKSWFIVDLFSIAPTDILSINTEYDSQMPYLGYFRCNRLLCGYKVFRVSQALVKLNFH